MGRTVSCVHTPGMGSGAKNGGQHAVNGQQNSVQGQKGLNGVTQNDQSGINQMGTNQMGGMNQMSQSSLQKALQSTHPNPNKGQKESPKGQNGSSSKGLSPKGQKESPKGQNKGQTDQKNGSKTGTGKNQHSPSIAIGSARLVI